MSEQKRFTHIVGDKDQCFFEPLSQPTKFLLDFLTRDWIQRPERLVQKNDRRVRRQRSRHTDSLPLATGKLAGKSGREAIRIEAYHSEQLPSAGADSFRLPTLETRDHADILFDGEMRKQSNFLNHVADAPAQLDRVPPQRRFALDSDLPFCRIEQPVDKLHRRRLTRAASSEEHQSFSPGDLQIQIGEKGSAAGQAETHVAKFYAVILLEFHNPKRIAWR